MELREKIIQLGDSISYTPMTRDYGRAEFVICPVFKRGYIRELYIFPRQQPNAEYYYKVIPNGKYNVIDFTAYGGNHKDEPRFWQTYWCREHKCYSLNFYVPDDGDKIKINCHFGNTISLEWSR